MPNYIKLGNLRIEIPAASGGGGGGGGGGSSSLLTGLLAFYNLSDNADASGNGNTLINENQVTFSSGKIGDAANFNNSNWFKVNINQAIKTMACWLKSTSSGFKVLAENTSQQLQFLGSGALRVNGIAGEQSVGSGVNNGEWHHCAFVLSESQNCIYIDNQKYNLNTAYSTAGSGLIYIGAGYGGGFDTWTGQLDALGIWSRALTDAEVTELYNAGAGKEHPFA